MINKTGFKPDKFVLTFNGPSTAKLEYKEFEFLVIADAYEFKDNDWDEAEKALLMEAITCLNKHFRKVDDGN